MKSCAKDDAFVANIRKMNKCHHPSKGSGFMSASLMINIMLTFRK